MKKDKLESFIIENRNQFDDLELSADLWKNIDNSNRKSKIRKTNWNSVLWKAASVVIIFVASYFVHSLINEPAQIASVENNTEQLLQNNQEFNKLIEAEAYYVSKINNAQNKLSSYTTEYPKIQDDITNDIIELDSIYSELKNDLNENIANEQVIEAMIQNYRIKLEILEQVLSIIENSNNKEQNKNSEYYEI